MRIVSFASGSSGNCTLVESEHTRVLIDAGISQRQTLQRLEEICGLLPSVDAILVTHEHTDHISGLKRLAAALGCPVYASAGTMTALESLFLGSRGEVISPLLRPFKPEKPFQLRDIQVEPFLIAHDAAEPCGFVIAEESLFDGLNKCVGIATDLGTVTEEIRERFRKCDLVMLESNHDFDMLTNGTYPEDLKARIRSGFGHLSNDDAGQTLAHLAKAGRLRTAVLMHLSKNNNRPKLALETVQRHLNGTSVEIAVAPRDRMSEIFTI